MNKVNIRVYPDKQFGYIVEVFTNEKSIPVAVFGPLEKAITTIEKDSFSNFVNVFFSD